jgi:hypothetical protein
VTWQLQIPHTSPDELLTDALFDARAIPDPDDRRIAREVLLEARRSGLLRVGELLDRIEGAGPDERRAMLDQARERVGLEPTGEVDFKREFDRLQASFPRGGEQRDENGMVLGPTCAEEGCTVTLLDQHGALGKVRAKAWRCEAHREGHEADMEDWAPRLGFSEIGLVIDLDQQDREREQARRWDERLAAERARQQAEREAKAAGYAAYEAARQRQFQAEAPDPFFVP